MSEKNTAMQRTPHLRIMAPNNRESGECRPEPRWDSTKEKRR
jgi:hypothetical protein